jgi:hypothetical protein
VIAQALFLLALSAALAGAIALDGLAINRAARDAASVAIANGGVPVALGALERSLANQIEAAGSTHPRGGFVGVPPAQVSAGLTIRADVLSTSGGAPPVQSAACVPQSAPAAIACRLQTFATVDEQRVSALASATATDPSGAPLAAVSRLVTLRISAVAPYAVVVGVRDPSSAAGGDGAQGDVGGVAPSAGDDATPNLAEPQRFRDTQIHVLSTCANDAFVGTLRMGTWWDAGVPAVSVLCDPGAGAIDEMQNRPWDSGENEAPY